MKRYGLLVVALFLLAALIGMVCELAYSEIMSGMKKWGVIGIALIIGGFLVFDTVGIIFSFKPNQNHYKSR